MIFAGDVAVAHGDRFDFEGFPHDSLALPWCLNLEGAITGSLEMPDWGTSNSSAWIESFSRFTLGPVFIGNNHIHDIKGGIQITQAELARSGLEIFGAGTNIDEASKPAIAGSGRHDYVLLGFGWPVIGCKPAGRFRPGVNRLDGASVLHQVTEALRNAGSARVAVVIHGNYEFERYPQPAHRKLAKALIDLGVHAVIAHHPHIVGPVERYKGKTIAYSLGNWAFSYGRFFGGRLRFPESSFHQIAIELGDDGDTIHHARFAPPTTIDYQFAERAESSDFSLKPDFEGLDDTEYVVWFKANRIKRKGLPIYEEPNASVANSARDLWVKARQVGIDNAARLGLKSMRPRSR